MTFDTTIIGGGIVGLATAWTLLQRQPGYKIAVVEKEAHVGTHQTDRNSGVIHSGIYYKPGSAKAVNCVKGYGMLLAFCKEHEIPFELCGKIILATRDDQLQVLQDIYARGIANGLSDLKFLDEKEVKQIEPYAVGVRGIRVPQAGIIDYRTVANKLGELIVQSGGEIITGFEVKKIQALANTIQLHSGSRIIESDHIIACGGLYSDRLAKMAGLKVPHQIVPFRGEFYQLSEDASKKVHGLIYPVPDVNFPFLGVHLTKRINGGVEAGPNAVLAFRREGYKRLDVHAGELSEILQYKGFQRLAMKHWKKGITEMQGSFSKSTFLSRAREMMPSLEMKDLKRGRTGVRAQALDHNGNMVDDFVILQEGRMIHVLNAPSPAATSCLSIGDYIATKCIEHRA